MHFSDAGFDKMHYSVMVALMNETYLYIQPLGSNFLVKVHVPKGYAICWRGDIGHAGAEHPVFPGGHYRLFMHVDAKNRSIPHGDSLYEIGAKRQKH